MELLERGHPLHRRASLLVGDLEVGIRPVLPTDALEIARLVTELSERSRYHRFHAPVLRLTERQLTTIVDVDHHRAETLVITQGSGRKERIVGFGQFLPWNDGEVEISLLVRDDLQGRGLGRVLATRLIAAAAESGYRTAVASVLAENQRMISLARHLPQPEVGRASGSVLEYRFDLTADDRTAAVLTA